MIDLNGRSITVYLPFIPHYKTAMT